MKNSQDLLIISQRQVNPISQVSFGDRQFKLSKKQKKDLINVKLTIMIQSMSQAPVIIQVTHSYGHRAHQEP
jgi:3-deoxy-D-arabino-heptulosonate 7-phosphate (DAHP) synthase